MEKLFLVPLQGACFAKFSQIEFDPWQGGGLHVTSSSTVTLNSCTVSSNTAVCALICLCKCVLKNQVLMFTFFVWLWPRCAAPGRGGLAGINSGGLACAGCRCFVVLAVVVSGST